MALYVVTALLGIADKVTQKMYTEMVEKTYHIHNRYTDENPDAFLYRVKSIFLHECFQNKIDGIDLKKIGGDYYVDAAILDVRMIPPEELLDFYDKNPGISIYSND